MKTLVDTVKKQENGTHNISVNKNTKTCLTLSLADKDFKTPNINIIKDFKKKINIMSGQMSSLSREMDIIKRSHMEILELKTLFKIKIIF